MRRQLISLGLVAVLTYVSMGLACDRASNLRLARIVVGSLRDAQPLLVTLGLPDDKITLAVTWGDKLVVALANPDSTPTDKREIVARLIDAFEQVVLQTNVITDPHKKTLILAILGIAQIALNQIANNVEDAAKSAKLSANQTIGRFAAKRQWRCRDAVSGKFKKMEYCKANPATSVVETY